LWSSGFQGPLAISYLGLLPQVFNFQQRSPKHILEKRLSLQQMMQRKLDIQT
jgi:hypothetical protein